MELFLSPDLGALEVEPGVFRWEDATQWTYENWNPGGRSVRFQPWLHPRGAGRGPGLRLPVLGNLPRVERLLLCPG